MQANFPVRLILIAAVVLIVAAVVVAALFATDTVLSIWQRLNSISPWVGILYLTALILIASLTAWASWRLLAPRKTQASAAPTPLDRTQLEQRIQQLEAQGGSAAAARAELQELDRRQAQPDLYLALFGAISSGKSTLINALLPAARQQTSALGGTTTQVHYFHWHTTGGHQIQLVDLPGFAQIEGDTLNTIAHREAARAHLVIYLCDGDLNREQIAQLQALTVLGKPLIIALNKADQYSAAELQQIELRLANQLENRYVWDLAPIQAGGTETVTVIDTAGNEHQEVRPRPPHIEPLVQAIQQHLQQRGGDLQQHQAGSGLLLAAQQLAGSEQQHRYSRSDEIVRRYSHRAVVGALAAVAPGADIVIQGALATAMVQSLCKLYQVPVREVDIDRFLQQANHRLKRNISIVMAVAGNGLKAFPGVGTIAGGLIHAVAYGMIFDSLGRALARALSAHTEWRPEATLAAFEEQVVGDLETPAKYLVRTAMAQLKERATKPSENGHNRH